MPWYKKLHWQIIVGLVLGLAYGIVAAIAGWGGFTSDWIAPFGTIFLNLLKLIAVPLVLASLVVGVTSLSDLGQLSRIGGKTMGMYLMTTAIAIAVGLLFVNVMQPGDTVPQELSERLQVQYQQNVEEGKGLAESAQQRGPLQPLVDMVPGNFFNAATDNANMLQIVFVAIFVGIGLLMIPGEKSKPLVRIFDSLNDLVIKLVEIIMLTAPVGVFALLADTITTITADSAGDILSLLGALAYYCLAVVLGLATMVFVAYPLLLRLFTGMPVSRFFSGIAPAQLVAFSTSSSGATLPATMRCAEDNLGVSEEASSFVLPLGATINMDGTALYQGVAALFIAQVLGIGLALGQQIELILLVVLISIGTAAVPSAGIVMLVIVLENFGIPAAGIALIVGVDRPLDMLRTTNNITGDAMVASVVADSENQLAHEAAAAAPSGDGMAEDVESSVGEPARRPARSSEQ
ncbi:MAG: dicarboxylate/amino acid:cation symporter [Bacteroidetes bacterium QS_8_68_28]|nr:MAG: dicarboxylate/amino acid:cation symporter [Bacteroidetes bacterium QS_8_68_28]